MKVTVIVPTHNRGPFVGHTIASLVRQMDTTDLDILVVDDGSTDPTPTVLEDWVAKVPAMRVITQNHAGVAAARNTGIANLLPETELVSFLDSDDISPARRFATDLPLFQADPDLDLIYSRLLQVDAMDYATLAPPVDCRQVNIRGIQVGCAVFRRRFLEHFELFDQTLIQAEDLDFFLRVFEAETKYVLSDTVGVYYLKHSSNMTLRWEENQKHTLRVLHKLVQRRRANPELSLKKEIFDVKALKAGGFF